jgi:prepilin-type N-terminal cleavage/methylation domain-containing protein
MSRREESGFSLVEVLVAIALFSVLSAGFYAVMFSQVAGSERSRAVVRVSEEARLGFNRLVRDTREGTFLGTGDAGFCPAAEMAAGECYNVKVDFNGDGVFSNPTPGGDYENLTFIFDEVGETIDVVICDATGLAAGCETETLIAGVRPISPGRPVFAFFSNILRHDANKDGVTSWPELVAAVPATERLRLLSSVSFAFQLGSEDDGDSTEFFTEAQLRNRRFGQF